LITVLVIITNNVTQQRWQSAAQEIKRLRNFGLTPYVSGGVREWMV